MELNNYTDYGKEALLKVEEALSDIKNIYNQISNIKTAVYNLNLPLGCIFAVTGDYAGENVVKLDGSVLAKADYPRFYDYVVANIGLINTCTNDEFEASVTASGYCDKFVVDEEGLSIRIPLSSGLVMASGLGLSPLYIVVKCNEI